MRRCIDINFPRAGRSESLERITEPRKKAQMSRRWKGLMQWDDVLNALWSALPFGVLSTMVYAAYAGLLLIQTRSPRGARH
jgi:hypothetical protein